MKYILLLFHFKLPKPAAIIPLVLLVFIFASFSAFAYTDPVELKEGIYTYNLCNGGAEILYVDEGVLNGAVSVPESLGGYPVTTIKGSAYYGQYGITSLRIPASVACIEQSGYLGRAFDSCVNLMSFSVDDNNSAFSIVDGFLYNKDKTVLVCCPPGYRGNVNVKTGTEIIGDCAFYGCNYITGVTLPNGILRIELGAFMYCNDLENINFPNGITFIGGNAFFDCHALKSAILPLGITAIGESAFSFCGNLSAVRIPVGVTQIYDGAFMGCTSLSAIDIPDGMQHIGSCAFSNTGIREITLPDSLLSLNGSFIGCPLLEILYIPKNVQMISGSPVGDCPSLKYIKVSEENQHFIDRNGVLFNKDISTLIAYPSGKTDLVYIVPDSVEKLSEDAFRANKHLTELQLPHGVKNIGSGAFMECIALEKVNLPNTLISIGHSAFSFSGIRSISLPNSLTYLGSTIFFNCENLRNIKLPANLPYIPQHFLQYCSALEAINIPNGVTAIGSYSFYGCAGLKKIFIPNSVTDIDQSAFIGISGTIYGYSNSYAETYAKNSDISFSAISETTGISFISWDGNYVVFTASETAKIALVGVSYDSEGRITSATISETIVLKGENSIPLNISSEGKITIYAWSSLESMTPICGAYTPR